MTKISVVIIARNNAHEIGACLKSVKGADEVIVLDTGSNDTTPQIALSHRAKVYYSRWEDDFSEARNKALEYATSPWIFSIDTDEKLMGGIEKLKNAIDNNISKTCIGIRITDLEKSFYGQRLFKKNGTYWIGRIHEELNVRGDALTDEVWIQHVPSLNHGKEPDRNIRILRSVLESSPLSVRDMFYLGMELFNQKQYESALYWLQYFVESSPRTPHYTGESYYLICECYCKLQRANRGVEALHKAIDVCPEMKCAYQRLGQLTKQDKWFEMANKATNRDVLILRS